MLLVYSVQVCLCVQVCMTDQCAESLWWVSTCDSGGVNSDLHHLLHVGRWRLTSIKLPSRPRLWATQWPTHIKLTTSLTLAKHRQEEEEEEEMGVKMRHGGQSVRQTGSSSGGQKYLTHFYLGIQTGGCHGGQPVIFLSSWLPGENNPEDAPPTNRLQQKHQWNQWNQNVCPFSLFVLWYSVSHHKIY